MTAQDNIIDIGIPVSLQKLIDTRALIQAGSGGGKSYMMRCLAEAVGDSMQQIIIDPEGEFYTLREKFNFALVSKEGDIPLSLRYAEALAHTLLETSASAIIDLYELAPDQRILFVKRFLTAMINAPKELWHSCLVYIDESDKFCLSEDTELLTDNGWRKYSDIKIGDLAYAYDIHERKASLQPIRDIIIKDFDGDLNHLYNRHSIDSLVTDDHRVVCSVRTTGSGKGVKSKRNYRWSGLQFRTAMSTPTGFKVPVIPNINDQEDIKIDDDLLSILGWVITDGARRKNENVYEIYQSVSKGKIYEKISNTIKSRFPKTTITTRNREGGYINGRKVNKSQETTFYIGSGQSKEIDKWLHGVCHEIPRMLLDKCSKRQLRVLFDAMINGNGTIMKSGIYPRCTLYCGYNTTVANQFQELCLKLGYSSLVLLCNTTKQTRVNVSFKREYACVKRIKKIKYKGIVWDITINHGAFVARRNGKPFITGNCPEGKQSDSAQSVINLCAQGRKRGFGCVLVTQRLSKLNKDASAELLNKLIGRTGQDIDRKRAGDELGFASKQDFISLRELEPGEFYAFGPAISNEVKKFTGKKVVTTHLSSGKRLVTAPPTPMAIRKILERFSSIPEEAEKELETKKQLAGEVKRLSAELAKAKKEQRPPDQAKIDATISAAKKEIEKNIAEFYKNEIARLAADLRSLQKDYIKAVGIINDVGNKVNPFTPAEMKKIDPPHVVFDITDHKKNISGVPVKFISRSVPRENDSMPSSVPAHMERRMPGEPDISLPDGHRRVLTACAQYSEGLRRDQLTVLTGYKRSTRDTYLQKLKERKYVSQTGDKIYCTPEGMAALGDSFEPLPIGEDLQQHWLSILPIGERKILEVLISAYPKAVSRNDIGDITGYMRSSRDTYLQKMAAKQIITVTGPGEVAAHPSLF